MNDTKVDKENDKPLPKMGKDLSDIIDNNICVIIGEGDDVKAAQSIFKECKA